MPCPELAFTELNRFWAVREQYDTAAYRRHCKRIASAVAGAIDVHTREGRHVVLVGVEGSPSMGVCITSSEAHRGGRPQWPDGSGELAPGEGIFIEECVASWRPAASGSPASWGSPINCPTTMSESS